MENKNISVNDDPSTSSSRLDTQGPSLNESTFVNARGSGLWAQDSSKDAPSQEKLETFLGRPWSPPEIKQRAHEMSRWIESDFDIPESLFLGASKGDRDRIKTIVRGLGKALYGRLETVDATDFYSDGDGTMFYKNPIMVDSTSSFGSHHDRHWNSILAKFLYFLGTKLSVLTARPGITAGQGIVGTEDPINNEKDPNVASPEEISACIGRERAEMDSFNVDIYGLSGGLKSKFGEPVELMQGSIDFNKLHNFLDREFGFVDQMNKIRYNDGDSMRVMEIKALSSAFNLIPGLTFDQYERYMLLAQQARDEAWDSPKFVSEVNKLGIPFPEEMLNPPDKPDIHLLDPNDPDAEVKLTEVLRDAHDNIICYTPHAIDGKNVYRDDVRAKIYDLILRCTRHPKTKAWLEQEFGIPQWADIVTINKKDISYVRDFESIGDLKQFIENLGNTGDEPKHKYTKINISDNNQFYLEIAGVNTKDQVIKRYQEALDSNTLCVMRGDSKGTDAPALAQAVISGGIAVIVRGLMEREDIGMRMVDLLRDDPADGSYVNAGHEDCLKALGDNRFQHLKTGEIKTKKDWAEFLIDKYKDQIFQIDNIHLCNAVFAFLFHKFFEQEGINFEPDVAERTIVDDPRKLRNRTLTTPDVGFIERGILNYMPEPKKSRIVKLLSRIPVLGGMLGAKMEDARPILTTMLEGIGQVLMWAGGVGIIGNFFSPKIAKSAKVVQRLASGVNNFASGITRGLRAPTRYPAQFLGEMCNFVSNFMPLNSYPHKILWAMGNGLLQLGRAGATISAENLILDGYKRGTEEQVEQAFGDKLDEYADIKPVAQKIVESRTNWIMKLKPIMGQFLAETVADIVQGFKMTGQYLKVKGYRLGSLATMFRKSGLTKTSMTSGKDYTNVASVSHVYSATGIFTLITSTLSILTHGLNNKYLNWFLTSLSNFIPTFGLVTAARNVEQDQHGHMRLFTDVVGREGKFDPEKAGWWQRMGAYGQAIGSWFLNTVPGQIFQYMGLGAYTKGIGHEFNPVNEMSAVNSLRKQGEYAEASVDFDKPGNVVDFVRRYFGRGGATPGNPVAAMHAAT